jgi:hypothetical protein
MQRLSLSRATVTAGLTLVALSGCSSDGTSSNDTRSSGGDTGTGGASASGSGGAAVGGAGGSQAGGAASSGGSAQTGGAAGSGGTATQSGGATNGGSGGGGVATGGASASGGTTSGGGGTASTGGTSGSGGSAGGDAGKPPSKCKRGIAANTAPGAAFFPAVTWWYNWAIKPSGADVGIEFVPMIWGSGSVNATLPAGAEYLLTFNEPNFKAQSNLTAAQAASYWPTIETKAAAANVPIVGPAMNYCGPAANCNGTSPYQYLKDFFAACASCKVDYVAVHWYNCDLPSLKDYLEPGGNLEGFEQFGKPIWLTEFSCDGNATVAQQEAFMRAAIPYLEGNPHVFRYSWFSAGPIPNAKLIDADGTPTALGNVYTSLAQSCP